MKWEATHRTGWGNCMSRREVWGSLPHSEDWTYRDLGEVQGALGSRTGAGAVSWAVRPAGESLPWGQGEIPAVFQRKERCLGLFSKDLSSCHRWMPGRRQFPLFQDDATWGIWWNSENWHLFPGNKQCFPTHARTCVCDDKCTQHCAGIHTGPRQQPATLPELLCYFLPFSWCALVP